MGTAFLAASILINIVLTISLVILYRYVRDLLKIISELTDVSVEVRDMLDGFYEHLQRVYKMQIYSGDKVLKNLIEDSKELADAINQYASIIGVFNKNEDEEEE